MEPERTWDEDMDEVDRRLKTVRAILDSIRASEHEYEAAEMRKQALIARSHQLAEARRARYASFWHPI
jgi:hypothetical protein